MLISLKEYAEKHGRDPSTLRYRILRGTQPGAVKIGRDWLIEEDAPFDDHRVTSGKYIGVARKRTPPTNDLP